MADSMHFDLSQMPAKDPPPGVVPNFVNPPTRAGMIIGISASLMTLSTIFLALRLYTRIRLLRVFGTTDYLLLAGYAFGIANSALSIAQTSYGLGCAGWNIPMSCVWPYGAKFTWWVTKTYLLSVGFSKISILSFYFTFNQSHRLGIGIWAVLVLVMITASGSFFWSLFQCVPFQNYWSFQKVIIEGKCLDKNPKYGLIRPLTTGITNIITDIAVLVLPVFMMWGIQLERRKKIAAGIVLGTGASAVAFSIIRMVRSVQIIKNSSHHDATAWVSVDMALWSQGETHAIVIGASLMTLRPLARHILPAWLSLTGVRSSERIIEPGSSGLNKPKDLEMNAYENLELNQVVNRSPRPSVNLVKCEVIRTTSNSMERKVDEGKFDTIKISN